MSSSALKILAMTSMIIDHLGALFFPDIIFLRLIGRLAFPIFAFLLVEGFFHTRDIKKYIGRLLIFFIISEIPYNAAFYNNLVYPHNQNIFLTLTIGLICVYYTDRFIDEKKIYMVFPVSIIGMVLAHFLYADYGILGICIILIFYFLHEADSKPKKKLLIILFAVLNGIGISHGFCYFNDIQFFAVLALIPVYFYNGSRGLNLKIIFYGVYPIHLALFAIINYVQGLATF